MSRMGDGFLTERPSENGFSDGLFGDFLRLFAGNNAHALFQRGVRLFEQRGVIGSVGHHFFHIVARFVERDGFGVNRAFQRR